MLNSALTYELNGNRLLSALPENTRYLLASHTTSVELTKGQILDDSDPRAYFPVDSIISLVSAMQDERTELAMIGCDGATGIYNALDFNSLRYRRVVHVPGSAYRIDPGVLRDQFRRGSAFSILLTRYLYALSAQIAQAAICYRRHLVRQRLRTWLTMTFNRLQSDNLKMRQNEIAGTLGYTRQSISAATHALQEEGIIRYSRGSISLLDRARLEQNACECYSIMESQYARIQPSAATEPNTSDSDAGTNLNELANIYSAQLGQTIDRVREICDRNDVILRRQRTTLNLIDAISNK